MGSGYRAKAKCSFQNTMVATKRDVKMPPADSVSRCLCSLSLTGCSVQQGPVKRAGQTGRKDRSLLDTGHLFLVVQPPNIYSNKKTERYPADLHVRSPCPMQHRVLVPKEVQRPDPHHRRSMHSMPCKTLDPRRSPREEVP